MVYLFTGKKYNLYDKQCNKNNLQFNSALQQSPQKTSQSVILSA